MRYPRMGLLLACLLVLALPAPALGAVNVTAFSVTGSTTQAGGHPDLTVSTSFQSNPSSDDVKDLIVRFPPGLLGNPMATPKCSAAQFAADTCPAGTALGSVTVTADATVLAMTFNDVVSQGTVYNLPPVGAEPARLGIKVRPAPVGPVVIEKISLIAVAKLGPETGYALETTIPDQPRTANSTAGPVQLQVTKVDLTLRGQPGATPFTINPSSCAPGTASVTAVPYDSGAPSKRTAPYTATGCGALPFGPLVSGTIGARGFNRDRSHPPLTTVLTFPDGNASLRDTVVLLPGDVGSDINTIARACPAGTPLPACPATAKIGSAEAASPLLAVPLRGPLILKQNLASALPDLVVDLKGASPLTLVGKPALVRGRLQNTFAGAPDVPLSRFTLKVNGGKGGLFLAVHDLCRPDKKQEVSARLTGWNGAVVRRKAALKVGGCAGYRPPKPKAKVVLRHGAGRLSVKVTAGQFTRLRSVRVALPKGVAVARKRLAGRAAARLRGRSLRVARGRVLRVKLSRKGAKRLSLVARRVKVARGLAGRRVRMRVAAKDDTGRTVRLRVRTRVRR